MALLKEALEEYTALLHSGFFWEFYPDLTGNWEEDEIIWTKTIYPKLLLSRFQYREFLNKTNVLHNKERKE